VHGYQAGSTRSLMHAIVAGGSTLTWLSLRRESTAAARVADALVIPLQFVLLQLAMPAIDWLGW
jgi:hypothetical protein